MADPKRITAAEFWGLVHDGAVNGVLDALEKYPDAAGVSAYRSQALEDTGDRVSFLVFGPSNTANSVGDLAEVKLHWSQAPESWCPAAELLAMAPPRFEKQLPAFAKATGPLPEPTKNGIETANLLVDFYKAAMTGAKGFRPAMVVFGKTVGYGAFFGSTRFHYKDRFVDHGVVTQGAEYTTYQFLVAGRKPLGEPVLRYAHGLPHDVGFSSALAGEWFVGGYYDGPRDDRHPVGPYYMISEYVPMNFGPYKDFLVDEGVRPRKRLELRVAWLDTTNKGT